MATEQDLHQAFINYLTDQLTDPPEGGVDPKLVEWAARYLDKREYHSVPTTSQDEFVAGKLAEVRKEHGV